ncbi:S-adenosyl-L-methionine-dependent methyltransferase [Lipomyces japonicus]|uniref:S-adenosyl-L-methionine-dependent methyltransferase n=1 Tax=Lipomyces japonicus TaxID=56871 RepID=UPI0034CF20D8
MKSDHIWSIMAKAYFTGVRILAHLLHLSLLSQLSKLSLSPLFGTSGLLLYRPLLVPSVFIISLFFFIKKRKRRLARYAEPLTLVYSAISLSIASMIGELLGPSLGPWNGPLVIDLVTLYPSIIGSSAVVSSVLLAASKGTKSAILLFLAVAATRLLTIFERALGRVLIPFLSVVLSGLSAKEQIVATAWASTTLLALSTPRWFKNVIGISVLFGGQWYLHTQAPALLPQSLASYEILASTFSTSGYVSVIDSSTDGLRLLRSDHSLLGGVFTAPPSNLLDEFLDKPWNDAEPVYSAFVMQEAIRLVSPPPKGTGNQNNALVIGLGIGSAASALIQHNVITDVVEFDPAVLAYAVKYFKFPLSRATLYIADGRQFVCDTAINGTRKYDYIIHDVFTGGVVAAELFTKEMWSDTQRVLSTDGVLAVNFGGDLTSWASKAMILTLVQGFRENGGHCRAFRDSESVSKARPGAEADFANVVVFCRHAGHELGFRDPVAADYLQSLVRHQALVPQHELRLAEYVGHHVGSNAGSFEEKSATFIITETDVAKVEQKLGQMAAQHWQIMNDVLNWSVWSQW